MNQNSPEIQKNFALFDRAFRPFFLSAAIFSILAISIWALFWLGQFEFHPLYTWNWWHGHEMLYGFAVPVIVGFLLTAVQNWTGVKTITGWPLFLLFLVWVAGRVLILFPGNIEIWAIALIDIMFLPLAAFFLAIPIVIGKNWKNLFFVLIFLMMSLLNGLMHYFAATGKLDISAHLMMGMVFWVTVVMVVMGGRVIPFFTSRGAGINTEKSITLVEKTAIASVVIIAIIFSIPALNVVPDQLMAVIAIIAFISNTWRLSQWKTWETRSIPLLWSLHLAYAFVAFSFFLMALYFIKVLGDLNTLVHMITIGGMGLLILSMMSRVSLGHTGRPLKIGNAMAFAYIMIAAAAVTRVFLIMLVGLEYTVYVYGVSAIFWLSGFGIFIWKYLPVLIRPRI